MLLVHTSPKPRVFRGNWVPVAAVAANGWQMTAAHVGYADSDAMQVHTALQPRTSILLTHNERRSPDMPAGAIENMQLPLPVR